MTSDVYLLQPAELPNRNIEFGIQGRMGYGDPRCHFVLKFERMLG
jgi:hypothetical protein